MNNKCLIRPIAKKDNPFIAEVIRKIFREFKIDKPGTVYTDPTTDSLYELFQTPKSQYWVVEENGAILGGCGLYPTKGLPQSCAELVKLYLSSEARGKGIGKELIQKTCDSAKELGYKHLYIESFPELTKAVFLYEKAGFMRLDKPMGNSGHFATTIWMIKDL